MSITVNPRFTDTRLTWTLNYYCQFALSLRKESPYIFPKFHPLIIIRALSVTPSVTVLTGLTVFVQFRRKIIVSNEIPLSHLSEDMHS